MISALWLLLYGGALTWLAPPLLSRLTRSGITPRMGVAAWLTALGAALLAGIAGVALFAVAAVDGLRDSSAVTLCLELFGLSEHTPLFGRLGSVALLVTAACVSAVVIGRVGRSVLGLRARSHQHAHEARMIGRPTDEPGVVVVDAHSPAAYCVSGKPNAIVITTGALDALDPTELAAVLAHENAHITGHHHQLLIVLRGLATSLPRLPLFRSGAEAVAELLEMCADDTAARRYGTSPLLAGLLILAGQRPAPADGLAAAGTAVLARALRLADPARPGMQWRQRIALGATMVSTLSAPAVIDLLCHH
ncbi:MAG: M56 family metallopeptidase [Mycobacteriaceae bacterium]|nr:M56 family metallopeptidase [Mycobacteriaceae bacterium]